MRSDSHRILPLHLEAVLREAGITQLTPATASPAPELATAPALLPVRPLAEQVAALERAAIAAAMLAARGNKVAAARMLGISRAKLYERLSICV